MIDSAALAYALVLGAVAAFNPCGFALLPAYITAIVTGSADAEATRASALRRAIRFGVAMSLGFLVVFLLLGLLFGGVSLALQASILPYVSYVTIVIGVGLVWLGVVVTAKGEMRGPGLRMSGAAPRTTFWSQVGYGAAFAVASLSCTIGLFLVVVAQALSASGPVAVVTPFVAYGVGMGTSVVLVSIAAALVGSGLASALRRHTVTLMRIGGVLMVVAGLYVVVFGLAEVLPRFGIDALDPVLEVTISAQNAVSQAVSSWGTPVLLVLAAIALVAVAWAFATGRREKPRGDQNHQAPASAIRMADSSTLDSIKRASEK
ncbi:cytochrome c biogenesis CcdA family protein [Demequina globuliformis]|uniref:cytochrome c biogenesis CcdA family protein n=1 Tax=Demequina globuliformis TaxID=676202 RepID=UPI0007835379|nr:cytochrome c biogenesis protein CcdA [Demequina globuliformis]